MKRKKSITWLIPRLLGLCAVWWVLWGVTGCEQAPGSGISQGGPEEEAAEEEEEQQQNPTAKLKGILIGSPPETLFYALGQAFDKTGLIVEGAYDDDTSRELKANEYTLSKVDTSRPGPQRVGVSAGVYTASFPIMVNNSDSVLQSISVSPPAGVVRYLGQVLGTEGFTVTGHYTEGDRVLSVFSVKNYDRTKRGAQTVTLSVNGKTGTLPVTVRVPANAAVQAVVLGTDSANPIKGHNNVFIKGQPLSLSNVRFRAAVTANNVTAVLISGEGIDESADLSGFNPGAAGRQTITLNLDDKKNVSLNVYVADKAPEVYFDYGFMRTADDPNGWGLASGRTEGCYHTQPDKTLVLSPVRALIGYDRDNKDLGVTYNWTVTPRGGTTASYTAPSTTGEFLNFTPADGGEWVVAVTVSGRNFVDGSTVSETATTAVICDTGLLTPPGNFDLVKHFSPGQFTESGTGHGWSLGAFGGYLIKPVTHKDRYTIIGNAGTWVEPGIVWFQEDQNENNLPDEMWYELNVGSAPSITRRYSLTYFKSGDGSSENEYGQTIRDIYWVDNKGRAGQINGGWPREWGVNDISDGAWVTYTGTLLFDNGIIKSDTYAQTEWPNCVDTFLGDKEVFPISGAVAADGSPVTLTKVRFVKVHTACFIYGGIFGEVSTEIANIGGAW